MYLSVKTKTVDENASLWSYVYGCSSGYWLVNPKSFLNGKNWHSVLWIAGSGFKLPNAWPSCWGPSQPLPKINSTEAITKKLLYILVHVCVPLHSCIFRFPTGNTLNKLCHLCTSEKFSKDVMVLFTGQVYFCICLFVCVWLNRIYKCLGRPHPFILSVFT